MSAAATCATGGAAANDVGSDGSLRVVERRRGRRQRRVETGQTRVSGGGAVERGWRGGALEDREEKAANKIRVCMFLWVVGGCDDFNWPFFMSFSCCGRAGLSAVPCPAPRAEIARWAVLKPF